MNKAPPKPKRSPGIYAQQQVPIASAATTTSAAARAANTVAVTASAAAAVATVPYESPPTAPPILYSRREENIFKFPPDLAHNLVSERRLSAEASMPSEAYKKHCCRICRPFREDRGTVESLNTRLTAAIKGIDQLYHTYELFEGFLTRLDDTNKEDSITLKESKTTKQGNSTATLDNEFELEHSLSLLESIFGTEIVPNFKQSAFKRIRSKSMMEEDVHILSKERTPKTSTSRSYLLCRQSDSSENNKSKVSKWTKVKAAFKWERANVPPQSTTETINLMPVNHEVARYYLKVPTNPSGGHSSADSVISSSSGHFMSDTAGTPGTISSASSVDDIDTSCRQTMPRDSSKSDIRCDSRMSDVEIPIADMSTKSSSNKSLRRSKVFSDFEALPEDHVADIKTTTSRRAKLPPSPLNLNSDASEMPSIYLPQQSKSPKDNIQTISRTKRINSPGNSSVPSSPSKHSEFFGEFESEDISSGEFSEPTTPNCKTFQQKQDEVFQRYQLLLLKLDMEFKAKQQDFERSYSNRNISGIALRSSGKKPDEHLPNQVFNTDLVSTELLEENLTPEFKKKLHKWRIKKQNSLRSAVFENMQNQVVDNTSPTNTKAVESKSKIDWNLWSTGQMKLEGQGLSSLPDQKDLPEKFQKKLEQWNKIKSGGTASDNDSIKRPSKHNQSTRRGSDDDRWYKNKSHDKEKLAKLKAIVTPDHQSKNIEVQTAAGVMKFEGISRKFTRKLYEWEKARGIGPEASTFALLHPGYCPIDVRRINKESHKTGIDNSPTLSRSLSLDSITPSVNMPIISQQASSLSLNNVNELKSTEESADALTDQEFKKDDELEAVMVEVEEHIDDTASPLVTAHTLVEQQTPIYKYEEVQCNDYCNTRRVQSFESHTNLAPLLSALQRADELFAVLKKSSPDIVDNLEMRNCQAALLSIRNIYPFHSNNLVKPNVLNAVSDVQNELGRLLELSQKAPLNEACCQEIMEERNHEYNEELRGVSESLECLKQNIQGGGVCLNPRDMVPDISITTEDGTESSVYVPCVTVYSDNQLHTTLEATDEHSANSLMENETESTINTIPYRGTTNANGGANKKKLRLRKMGSRQNSKTESDSSDAEIQNLLETPPPPRRLRRQKFRIKQRSLDDDFRLRSEEPNNVPAISDDILYKLKVKPGKPIEQSQLVGGVQQVVMPMPMLTPTPESVQAPIPKEAMISGFVPQPLPETHIVNYNTNVNVFVKTKRKLFTTIAEPTAIGGIAVIEKELDSLSQSDESNTVNINSNQILKLFTNDKPRLLKLKSISLDDISLSNKVEDFRKSQSTENIEYKQTDVRTPLASDSFRVINNSIALPMKGKKLRPQEIKEHLYKKHVQPKSLTVAATKIERKIANTAMHRTPLVLPNKMDNTLPRIHRKLEGKSLTPTIAKQFQLPKTGELFCQTAGESAEQSVTQISDRALRLQRAKAEFLQSPPTTPTLLKVAQLPATTEMFNRPIKSINELARNQTWEQYNCNEQKNIDIAETLQKSISVGVIAAVANDSAAQSDIGNDQESVCVYETLPRMVSRSGKISSKLGFASLASKLRRVKVGGKKHKDNVDSSGSALSALCRQTLMADVIALPQMIETQKRPTKVLKSQSSPYTGNRTQSTTSREGLNKSLSEQYVKHLKESDV